MILTKLCIKYNLLSHIFAQNLSLITQSLHKPDNLEKIFKKFKISKNWTLQSILAKFNTKGPLSIHYICMQF